MDITEEIVRELKAKHPRAELHRLTTQGGFVIVRTPTRAEKQRFIDELAETDTKGVALGHLVDSCVVWPDEAGWQALLEQRPFLSEAVGNDLIDLFGLKRIQERKKL